MTVSYQYEVASSTSGGFTRLLFKWKGSLYKLVYRELFFFCCLYAAMSCFYRYLFSESQKRQFEKVVVYCDTYMGYIPLSFILGFYVSFVASRWWQQYMAIPWPDKIIHAIALHVIGYDEKGRMMRRALVRYLNLSLVLILRSISSAVKKRFPTLEHLVEAGFITSTELGIYNTVPNTEFNTYWIPCTWFTHLLKDARNQKRITDPMGIKHIMEEFNEFRQKCGLLWSYDWVSIPLVYTQVVTIATYSFFLAAIVGRQYVEESPNPFKKNVDLYIPFFTMLQFFFYMGLLKVAEQLINPFGDDDEDFELNWIIDRHMKVSYLIVDTLLLRTPPLCKDIFYDDECPVLPYTEASAEFKKRTYRGSVANMVIPEDKQNLLLPDIMEELEECSDFKSTRNLASQLPSVRSSANNLGGIKDQRSLSVPDEGVTVDGRSPSPRDAKNSKSAPISRTSSRRLGTAGSKGISSALLAIGSRQGFIAADPEKISLAGYSAACGQDAAEGNKDDIDYLSLPVSGWGKTMDYGGDMVAVEMGLMDDEGGKDGKGKSKSSRITASIKAKLAVKKKPVITWRPYERRSSTDLPHVSVDDLNYRLTGGVGGGQMGAAIPDEALQEGLPPGEFEDECAFMWRTIEDDSESLKTAMSIQSEDFRSDGSFQESHMVSTGVLAHYKDVKPNTVRQDLPIVPRMLAHVPRRPLGVRRARFRTRGRLRCSFCSMPHLCYVPRGSVVIHPNLIRSISENSVFLEAATKRVSAKRRSQDKSYFFTKPQMHLSLRPSSWASSQPSPQPQHSSPHSPHSSFQHSMSLYQSTSHSPSPHIPPSPSPQPPQTSSQPTPPPSFKYTVNGRHSLQPPDAQ